MDARDDKAWMYSQGAKWMTHWHPLGYTQKSQKFHFTTFIATFIIRFFVLHSYANSPRTFSCVQHYLRITVIPHSSFRDHWVCVMQKISSTFLWNAEQATDSFKRLCKAEQSCLNLWNKGDKRQNLHLERCDGKTFNKACQRPNYLLVFSDETVCQSQACNCQSESHLQQISLKLLDWHYLSCAKDVVWKKTGIHKP